MSEVFRDVIERLSGSDVNRITHSFDDDHSIARREEYIFDYEGNPYRVRVDIDDDPEGSRNNYRLTASKKKELSIDDGYTRWRRVPSTEKYLEGYRPSSFATELSNTVTEMLGKKDQSNMTQSSLQK